jgi:hypothetical protein
MALSKAALEAAKFYNAKQIRPSEPELALLVEAWQASHGLTRDGKFGPRTLEYVASVVRAIQYGAAVEPSSSDVPVHPKLEVPTTALSLPEMALVVANEELGNGEGGTNNMGPHVRRYCGREGVSWCAGFAGYCYEQAALRLGVALPFSRSLGAKKLVRNVAAVRPGPHYAGVRRESYLSARPGDLIAWHRGKAGSWQGHVELVERLDGGIVHTIGGNVGPYPARVRRLAHDPTHERIYIVAGLSR